MPWYPSRWLNIWQSMEKVGYYLKHVAVVVMRIIEGVIRAAVVLLIELFTIVLLSSMAVAMLVVYVQYPPFGDDDASSMKKATTHLAFLTASGVLIYLLYQVIIDFVIKRRNE
ncbi:hypothetical protein O0L34_g13815 [Tuta absoluta]|nr:hypothetical protein O0L34_g13815 [Tuta absoluta]